MANVPESRRPPNEMDGTNGRLERTRAIDAGTKVKAAGPADKNLGLGKPSAKLREQDRA